MMDAVGSALAGAASHSPLAPALALVAGVASSFGPCVAPRLVAIAGLTAGLTGVKRWLRVGAFVAGLCAGYVGLGVITGALSYAAEYATYLYAGLALGLTIWGLVQLLRPPHGVACAATGISSARLSLGASFLAGSGFAIVASPCCGPIAVAIAGMTVASGSVAYGALLLASFALGHAVPLFGTAAGAARLRALLGTRRLEDATATVTGALTLALGGYYALLA